MPVFESLFMITVAKHGAPLYVWAENFTDASKKAEKWVNEHLKTEEGYVIKSIKLLVDSTAQFINTKTVECC